MLDFAEVRVQRLTKKVIPPREVYATLLASQEPRMDLDPTNQFCLPFWWIWPGESRYLGQEGRFSAAIEKCALILDENKNNTDAEERPCLYCPREGIRKCHISEN